MFTTTEAATLAQGCLVISSGRTAGRLKVLKTLAMEVDRKEVSETSVNKAIDEGIVAAFRDYANKRVRARRLVDETAILYVLCTHLISLHLDASAKRNLYKSISKLRNSLAHRSTRILVDEYLFFDAGAKLLLWRDSIAHYASARDAYVVRDPEVMGGMPTLRGTRIPVHSLAARIEGGDSLGDIKKDYPYLKQEALLAALAYAKANPRLGRPMTGVPEVVAAPWDA